MANSKPKILVAVTNDVSTDQRVHKVSNYLISKGFEVVVYGRVLPDTFEVARDYSIIRKNHWFHNNFLFYAEYNIRLLFFLLTNKSEYILSNDLDTLPACYLASRFRKRELVYDSHELFTEVPELQGRKFVRNFWRRIEHIFLPKVKKAYTVSGEIAIFYKEKYNIDMGIVKNVPYLKDNNEKESISFPTTNKVVLYQGTLTENRGLKQTMLALNFLKDVDLVIIGYGKEEQNLKDFAKEQNLNHRVHFLGRILHERLHNYTKKADVGILLEEPVGLSFKYALPNKLFDYIHCELPILAFPLLEVKKIIELNNIGVLVENHEPKHIAEKIHTLLSDKKNISVIKSNQRKIREKYCWEEEQKKLAIYFT